MSNEKLDKDETLLDYLWGAARQVLVGPKEAVVSVFSLDVLKKMWERNIPAEGIIAYFLEYHPFSDEQLATLKLLAQDELIQISYEDFERVVRDYHRYKRAKPVSRIKDTTGLDTKMLIQHLSKPVVCGTEKFIRHELEENEEYFLPERFNRQKAVIKIKENIDEVKEMLGQKIGDKMFEDAEFRRFLSKKFNDIREAYTVYDHAPDARARNIARAKILEFTNNQDVLKESVDYLTGGRAVSRFGVKLLSAVIKKNYCVWEYVNEKEIKKTFSSDFSGYPVLNVLYSKKDGFKLLESMDVELTSYMRTIRVIEHMTAKNTDMAFRLWFYFMKHDLFREGPNFKATYAAVKARCEGTTNRVRSAEVEFDMMIYEGLSEIRAHLYPKEQFKKEKATFEVDKARRELRFEARGVELKIEENEEKIAKVRSGAASMKKSQLESEVDTVKSEVAKARAGEVQDAAINKDIAASNAAKAKSDAEIIKSQADSAKAVVQNKRADELVTADLNTKAAIDDLKTVISDAQAMAFLGLTQTPRRKFTASASNLPAPQFNLTGSKGGR